MRVINFSAGPAVLPETVLRRAAEEMLDWHGSGMSVMEMSHRGPEFTSIAQKAEADFRHLLGIPDHYKVLFMQGGAMAMNAIIPMNLLGKNPRAAYVNTGEWSKKSISEARKYGQVDVLASAEDRQFSYVPPQSGWKSHQGAAYVHICTNETIGGVEYHWVPDTGDVPLVADMSSHILSREIDVSKYAVIYGGAQKNIGPAGLTFVIVREDLLDAAIREFEEEVGIKPNGPYLELGSIRQKGGKTVHAWAFAGDYDDSQPLRSNHVQIEWPPGSGRWDAWPEIDRASFFTLEAARERLKLSQHPLLERLLACLASIPPGDTDSEDYSEPHPSSGSDPSDLKN